jgi:glycosyltransferase involved in cell wall biosynthesis
MEQDRLSIIIPVFNRFEVLQNAISSVLKCVNPHYELEIIVVNDGSTDGDYSFYESDFVRVFNQENKGVSAARNQGIKLSTGNWLFFLDADDEIYNNSLLYRYLSVKKSGKLFICGAYYITYDNVIMSKKTAKLFWLPIYHHLPFRNVIATSTVGLHRKLIQDQEFFPEHIGRSEDWIAWNKVVSSSNATYVKEVIAIKNEDGLGITHREELAREKQQRLKILYRNISMMDLNHKTKFRLKFGLKLRLMVVNTINLLHS